jgi:mono/diheme cytochrome c family protein
LNPYVLPPEAGDNLTNLGSCVPAKRIVATEKTNSEKLDTFFASLQKSAPGTGTLAEQIGLPERLDQTDLSTFDTEILARSGVIAFVPAYPLWSDGSGKLRHVRVPRGQSIRFNAKTQSFEIPANTRFYKTFLKKIIDVDGVPSYRKIETRIIVVRRDTQRTDGTNDVTALFGTYAWNEDETEATLVTDPLRNGEPFRDRLITYVTDEPLAQYVRNQKPNNLTTALEKQNAIRRYAIPGRDRCVQCHMGSPMGNFILGFLPVQINRRRLGESGVIDAPGEDELNQLQRLIDYGVVSEMTSPSDVWPLESLEGNRTPRNDSELVAQGYMLGNCAHCHNPRGFPSVSAPVLSSVLNFLPSATGGIFQFPLERTSPRIFRGLNNDVPVPYITPSLMDLPVADQGHGGEGRSNFKWQLNGSEDKFTYLLQAPWRSLIYRNVSTPFTYADDNALFPHMPMNVAGFDCRAPRILGDWMVSIPAVWKDPKTNEFSTYNNSNADKVVPPKSTPDFSTQPYAEVKAEEGGYKDAKEAAKHRLDLFHGVKPDVPADKIYNNYDFCPDTSDIVDREVVRDPVRLPVPGDNSIIDTKATFPVLKMPSDGVPDRAHWVVTDLTEVLGEWNPRRADWKTILVDQQFTVLKPEDFGSEIEYATAKKKQEREMAVVKMLQTVKLDTIESYAKQPFPLGLWLQKDGCNFAGEKKVSELPAEQRAPWMDGAAPDAPVYNVLPGEAVYGMICINCHGSNFDSLGRQSDNLMLMTGGNARVANFKTGLFGPMNAPGTNRPRVYGPFAPPGATPDDMGARYMAWMALGGTSQIIPPSLLAIVSNTDVLGQRRKWRVQSTSANMLDTAKALCGSVVGLGQNIAFDPGKFAIKPSPSGALGLIEGHGDATLWRKLCAISNPPPVRAVLAKKTNEGGIKVTWELRVGSDLYPPDKYPSTAPVVDHFGHVVNGITADNLVPWCIREPLTYKAVLDQTLEKVRLPDGSKIPYCPTTLVPPTDEYPADETHYQELEDDLNNLWATRGAINAGLSVFLFLKGSIADGYQPKPRYDRCDLLAH